MHQGGGPLSTNGTPHDTEPPTIGATSRRAPARLIRSRPGLPGSRSVVGGLLVALATLGTWWAATGAGRDPADRYVVTSRSVGPGERLGPDDVRLVEIGLPGSVAANALTSTRSAVGSVALGPIGAGELVQASSVGRSTGSPEAREVSFTVESDWAVGGTLRVGDRIDVFATDDGAGESTSRRVLAGAQVRRLAASGGDGLGESATQTITVTVEGVEAAEELVTAARASTITVLRATGTGGGR